MTEKAKRAATEAELEILHNMTAQAYQAALQKMIDEGEPNAALLTSASNFLKHNGIEANPDNADELKDLRDKTGEILNFPFDPQQNTG